MKNVRDVSLMGLLTLLVTVLCVLSGCKDDKAPGCERDADCRGDRVCSAGTCVDPDDVNNANNANNANNTNNVSGCGGDLECGPEEVCDEGACGQRACDGDPDCGAGARFCYAGLCRAAIDCDGDDDCGFFNNGYCDRGRCTPGCVIDGDCPNPQAQACDAGVCRARCGADGDCDRGEICEPNVCREAECQGAGTEGCPGGQRCDTGRCVDFTSCDSSEDCGSDEICREGICEPRTSCVGDPQCPDGEQCLDGFCREIIDCAGREDCPGNDDCVGGRCVPFVCRGDADCDGDQVCDEGACSTPDDADAAARVIILTPPQSISPGAELQLQAVALDDEGNILIGQAFAWESSDADTAEVQADTGLVVGGPQGGTVEITATAAGTQVTSAPLTLVNTGAADPNQDRVVVVDAAGRPLVGAVVVRGDAQETTDSDGAAFFPTAQGGQTVTVYEALHNTVTMVGVSGADLLVPMEPLAGGAVVGGFKGQMDYGMVSSEGDINVGLAGASLDAELTRFDLDNLLGDGFNTQISIPGLFETELPLPGGLVLDGTVFGFPISIKTTYYARSEGGLKVAWGIGGKIDAGEIAGLVGGGGDASNLLATLLPYFENFDHDVRPIEIDAIARVEDSADIDGDGDTAELVPDYDNFPNQGVSPRVRQRLRTSLSLPALPASVGDPQDTFVITVGGVLNQGIGLVPLGINATTDDNGDAIPEPLTLRMAPPHSGLSAGQYAVVALTFNPDDLNADLESGIDLPDNYSIVLWQGRDIPADLDLGQNAFLALPEGQYDAPGREFSQVPVEGADLFRVTFTGPEGSWEVWLSADTDAFTLPTPPDGFQDWSNGAQVRIDAFATRGQGLSAIAQTRGTGLRRLSQISDGFSRAVINP